MLDLLKGHNRQHSDQMTNESKYSTEKTIEIQLVRPTEVCTKV